MTTPSTDISKYDLTDVSSAISPAYAAGLIQAMRESGGGGVPSIDISEFDLTDETSVISPAYAAKLCKAKMDNEPSREIDYTDPYYVIGVQKAYGTQGDSGWPLEWVDKDLNRIVQLPSDYFDKHPSWQFTEVIMDGNYFRRIPICYTKRGISPITGNWYMMLSPVPRDGFEPHYTAFMYKGVLKDSFLWATYRAFNNSGKPGSQPGKPHWKSVSWDAFTAAAVSLGDGYHMGSFQEYHEILMRAVIERKTFNLWPVAVRRNYQANHYRGIEEMAYDRYADDSTNGTCYEWRSGVRTDANRQLEVWNTDGNQNYVKSGKTPNVSRWIGSLLTGTHFDHMFFAETAAPSIEQSMIPDHNYTARTSRVAYSCFYASSSDGAFCSSLYDSASYASASVGSRVAYIDPNGDNANA